MDNNCEKCYWWNATWGCNNTNWTTGVLTDPKEPVCNGWSFKVIHIKAVS